MKILSNRSGMTILETIIVLIIGGLIISGIWVTYSEMSLNDKIRRTVNAIDKTTAKTRDFLSARTTVPADLSVRMHDQNLMPAELTFKSTAGNISTYTSPLSNDFYVTANITSDRMFFVRVAFKRGSRECQRLAPIMLGTDRGMNERGIVGYSLGTLIVGEQTNIPRRTITPADLLQQCPLSSAIGFYFAVRP